MISLWIMGGLLKDFMQVLMTCLWFGRTGINEPWGTGDRAISRPFLCGQTSGCGLGWFSARWQWGCGVVGSEPPPSTSVGTGCTRCHSFGPPDLLALQDLSTRGLCVPLAASQYSWASLAKQHFPLSFGGKPQFSNTAPFFCAIPTHYSWVVLFRTFSHLPELLRFMFLKEKKLSFFFFFFPPKPSGSLNDNCLGKRKTQIISIFQSKKRMFHSESFQT